jgi:hypothetical protein
MMKFLLLPAAFVVASASLGFGASFPSPPLYPSFNAHKPKIITFDVPNGVGTTANGINKSGVVTGYFRNTANVYFAFIRKANGKIKTFATTNSIGTTAQAINAGGVVIGGYADTADTAVHGFVRAANGTIKTLDAKGAGTQSTSQIVGTTPLSINSAGVVVGNYVKQTGLARGFMFALGTITEFAAPGAGTAAHQGTFPQSVNTRDFVTGWFVGTRTRGFVRSSDDKISSFDAPAGKGHTASTFPFAIDDAGAIAGQYTIDGTGPTHGFVRNAGGIVSRFDVSGSGTAAGQGTFPLSINTPGAIAGYYIDQNTVLHGFIRSPTGTITTIDVPGAGTANRQGTSINSINDKGVVTGGYIDGSNLAHGFVRKP